MSHNDVTDRPNSRRSRGADRTLVPGRRRFTTAVTTAVALAAIAQSLTVEAGRSTDGLEDAEFTTLDGSGNNIERPGLGAVGSDYRRIAPANYADGVGVPIDGPPERLVSNRIFDDLGQNIFSENDVTHWGFVWGQFVDHTIGLRGSGDESYLIDFDATDPLERFENDLDAISLNRSQFIEGTGIDTPREQLNTVSSYIDGFSIYGGTDERLDWLRAGPLDGDPTNNEALLLLDEGSLPTTAMRPDSTAPEMELAGRLFADPSAAVVAGDVRANENIALTAVHTLLAREHNRIVGLLPDDMDEETKFQIARRVVTSLQQHITYEEFLPSMGIELPRYSGYDPTVDPTLTNEFASVGYRPHSQIHGEFETGIDRANVTDEEIADFEARGIEVEIVADDAGGEVVELAIPLNIAFANPQLLAAVGVDNVLAGLSSEAAYANDEQIDDQLRSVLFQIPGEGVENPEDCLDGEALPECFTVVNDLGAIDIARGRDHGIASYNDLREAYGLERRTSFSGVTGEDTEDFVDDGVIDLSDPINDPAILDFVFLADADGNELEPGSDAADTETVTAIRRSTIASRLSAIYGDVDSLDAFTGMVSEPHVPGTEFGELQLAIWSQQFQSLRDGDRFFYQTDPVLREIRDEFGIDSRRSLAEVIRDNTEGIEVPDDVFVLEAAASDVRR